MLLNAARVKWSTGKWFETFQYITLGSYIMPHYGQMVLFYFILFYLFDSSITIQKAAKNMGKNKSD